MTMLQRSNLSVEKSRSLPVEIKVLEQYDLQIANTFLLFSTSILVNTHRLYNIFCVLGFGQKYLEDHKLMILLSCQPKVTVTSCFVYKVIRGLRINRSLVY